MYCHPKRSTLILSVALSFLYMLRNSMTKIVTKSIHDYLTLSHIIQRESYRQCPGVDGIHCNIPGIEEVLSPVLPLFQIRSRLQNPHPRFAKTVLSFHLPGDDKVLLFYALYPFHTISSLNISIFIRDN